MNHPELVLSNTTSFFSGNIENLFKNARKYGFHYIEIVPSRGIKPEQILSLQNRYGVKVAGIHLPTVWSETLMKTIKEKPGLFEQFFAVVFNFYLGKAKYSPGMDIARTLADQRPYLLIHSNVVKELSAEFEPIAKEFHTVAENIPRVYGHDPLLWDPVTIQNQLVPRGLKGLVFDVGHYNQTMQDLPELNLFEMYQQIAPEVIHISYNSLLIHLLPNKKEQEDLKKLLQIHQPKYITIETNPLISIKKGKLLLEKIIEESNSA